MQLPPILAGPIVRRVDAAGVSVWIALSAPATVTLLLWPGVQFSVGDGVVASGVPAMVAGVGQTRRFGANLHIAVVTARLGNPAALLPGSFHAYDVLIDGDGLRKMGLLMDGGVPQLAGHDTAPPNLALGFDEDRLPGFVAPAADLLSAKLVHGSCRRPSYSGYDATGWLDDHLAANRNDFAEWPQQHFMTGDQIYADDVAAAMLPMLMRLGEAVMGGTEHFSITEAARHTLSITNFPPMRRAQIVRHYGGMTSVESHNHLLGFSEFVAMYLAVWNPSVWGRLGTDPEMLMPIGWAPETPEGWPTDADLKDKGPAPALPAVRGVRPPTYDYLTHWEEFFDAGYDGWAAYERGGDFVGRWEERGRANSRREWKRFKESRYPLNRLIREQHRSVVRFRETVPKVARVLANCSTYMTWDDHEVSDDWNAYGRWMARVHSRPAGANIVANAGMAYAIFQAWGNDPAAFGSGNNRELLDQISSLMASAGPGIFPAEPRHRLHELLGFPNAKPDKRAVFHYSVESPVYKVVVLDTRSLRDPGSYRRFTPAKILGDSLNRQLPEGPLADGRELLILVSAGPILNPVMLDNVFRPLLAGVQDIGQGFATQFRATNAMFPSTKLSHQLTAQSGNALREVETWAAQPLHLEKMLARLAAYRTVVVLSGDVHLSNTMVMDYWQRLAPTLRGEFPSLGAVIPGDPLPPLPQPVEPVTSRIIQLTCSGVCNGWEPWQENLFRRHIYFQDLPAGVFVEQFGWHQTHGLVIPDGAYIPPARQSRLGKSPALVPALGWPRGTTLDMESRFLADGSVHLAKPPNWAWRLKLVSDTRPRSERTDSADPPLMPSNAEIAADPLAAHAAIAAAHAQETMRGPRLMRTMVFTPNIGFVEFRPTGNAAPGTAASPPVEVVHRMLSAVSLPAGRFGPGVVSEHRVPLQPTNDPEPVLIADRDVA